MTSSEKKLAGKQHLEARETQSVRREKSQWEHAVQPPQAVCRIVCKFASPAVQLRVNRQFTQLAAYCPKNASRAYQLAGNVHRQPLVRVQRE
jgi:hypothetical protein